MSIGYQLEQMMQSGDEDNARYLADSTLDDVLPFYIDDGYTDDEILDLVRDKIATARADA